MAGQVVVVVVVVMGAALPAEATEGTEPHRTTTGNPDPGAGRRPPVDRGAPAPGGGGGDPPSCWSV